MYEYSNLVRIQTLNKPFHIRLDKYCIYILKRNTMDTVILFYDTLYKFRLITHLLVQMKQLLNSDHF